MDEPSPRDIILSLPRDWLLANIEESIEGQLQYFDSFDYWQIAGFCADIDKNLTLRLARRAAGHSDVEIKETGEDYIEKLSSP